MPRNFAVHLGVLGFVVFLLSPRKTRWITQTYFSNVETQSLKIRRVFRLRQKKTASQGNKTRLRHFAFKVREMVKKLWSLIGVTFCRHTRFRCFGSISAGGSFATLHLSKKTVYPSKHGSGSVVLYRFRRSLTK